MAPSVDAPVRVRGKLFTIVCFLTFFCLLLPVFIFYLPVSCAHLCCVSSFVPCVSYFVIVSVVRLSVCAPCVSSV